jgi:hypothetical protein
MGPSWPGRGRGDILGKRDLILVMHQAAQVTAADGCQIAATGLFNGQQDDGFRDGAQLIVCRDLV